jgi:hypothetical protein
MTYAATAAFAALLILPQSLSSQTVPDFSGTWQMDVDRSQAPHQGEPFRMVTFVIAQSEGQIRIDATRGNERDSVLYPLTKSRAAVSSDATGDAQAYWDGDRLITETHRTISGQTVTVKEARALSANGQDMIVESTVIVQHGYSMPGARTYGSSKDVFTRAKP